MLRAAAHPDQQIERKYPIFAPPNPSTMILVSGFIFTFAALALFILAGWMLYSMATSGKGISIGVSLEPGQTVYPSTMRDVDRYNFYGQIVQFFAAPVLVILSGFVCGFVGIKLLRSAGAVSQPVIPPWERDVLAPAILAGNDSAIGEYIRLSSLSGITGTFTKLGLTGLPLATILLTILLSVLGMFYTKFFDLAQLTLGAFLGSYVQKKSGELTTLPKNEAHAKDKAEDKADADERET